MEIKPTESELEILQILWNEGPMTVRQVHDQIIEQRPVGYTTTLKTMQIMAEKGLLTRNTGQRSHLYSPAMEAEEVRHTMFDHFLSTVFRGNPSRLILHALGNRRIPAGELQKIRMLIREIEEDGDL